MLEPEALQLYYKKTPTQVFSCEYCEIFKNNLFYRTPLVATSKALHIFEITAFSQSLLVKKFPESLPISPYNYVTKK